MKFAVPKIKVVRIKYSQLNVVPTKYKSFLIDMNNLFAFHYENVYCGREKEVDRIFNCLLKTINPNVILLGKHGVGKSAIVQSAVFHILERKCPKELKDDHFIYWDIEKTLAVLQGDINDSKGIVGKILKFLTSGTNIIVVIDQVHLMATSDLLTYYFSVLLKSPNVKLIGIDTEEFFYGFFSLQSKVFSSVDIMHVSEPKSKGIYPMISEYVEVLSKRHHVKISEEIVNYAVLISAAFSSELCNPGLAINFIEKSMIVARRRKHEQVTRKDVNSNFNFNYTLYNQMPLEDKKITAYHEAGHFIVSKMSENIRNYKTTAITIVPAENFLGVTMFEFEPEKQTSCDSDYFIDNIATYLAGRVAETILQGKGKDSKLTSGAYQDLKVATQTARDIVTEFGMLESCGQNMTYFCNHDLSDLALLSDERKKLIDKETQKLIDEAYIRAENVLTKNRELLDLIAKELLSKEVLDEKDLNCLCMQVSKKNE